MSERQVVVIGLGELGSIFATGFLRCGRSVVPALRSTDLHELAARQPDPELVLVAVAEPDLPGVLATLPAAWRARAGLLQNELLPATWTAHGIDSPTVLVVWFEKKPGRVVRELLPTVVHGPSAELAAEALERVGLKPVIARSQAELVRALVEKNVYILTTNIAGIETGGTVRELSTTHRATRDAVLTDVIELQNALAGSEFAPDELGAALERAIEADPEHQSTGRSAPARLERALEAADALGLAVPELRRIALRRA